MVGTIEDQSGLRAFRPRARLLTTLGAELISSEVVAIIELVRNSWDADATEVIIEFVKPHLTGEARVLLRDDGHGMTREVLLGPWFEPATSHKSTALGGERSPRGRRRLGAKGVGRFAAQRLGGRLDLTSRPAGSTDEFHAEFDWTRIEHDDGYLDEVRIPWRVVAPAATIAQSGTLLEITALRDVWTWDRFEKLRIGLSRLLSQRLDRDLFKIILRIDGQDTLIEPALHDGLAMYSLKGSVHEGGSCTMEYRDQMGTHETWERSVLWPQNTEAAGPFDFQVHAWDLDKPALTWFLARTGSALGLRDFKRVIREHAGISLYRDGFRILPYGEPDNDWLRLDRRRVNNPTLRLSNNQVLGQFHLAAERNPGLKDQTNREGLVVNDQYVHLQHVAVELLAYLESRRFSARRSMEVLSSAARTSPTLPFERTSTSSASDAPSGAGSDGRTLRRFVEQQREQTAEGIQAFAGLAAVGQLSTLVFRQLDHPVRQAQTELKRLQKTLRGDAIEPDDVPAIKTTVDRVARLLEELGERMNRLEPLAAVTTGRIERTTLRDCVDPVLRAFSDEIDGLGIIASVKGEPGAAADTVPSVVQQVLAHLVDNAIYWLSSRKGGRRIDIDLLGSGIRIANTGPPIPAGDRTLIFEPHYTRREGARGLGLTVARELMHGAGGELIVVDTEDGAAFMLHFARPA